MTFEVSKELKFIDISFVHEENIPCILLTLDVSKPVKSKILNLELLNISFIFVTFEVSSLLKSNEILELELPNPLNIPAISKAFEVIKLSPNIIDVNAEHP